MSEQNKPIINDKSSPEQDYSSPTPAPASTTAPTPAPASTTAPTPAPEITTSGVNIQTEVPAEYKASNFAELIPELEKHMQAFKPLSEEELKKLRRKQKIEGIISGVSDAAQSIANLYFTTQYAPNMYNAKEGLSAKAKERFEKEKADRDAENEKYFNYAMQIGKMRAADQKAGLDAWKTEQTLARQDRNHNDDVAFRNKDYDERVRQWQASFDRSEKWHQEEGERWEKQFKESIRQFSVSSANERARISMEAQRLAKSLEENKITFNLGSGNGNVTLTMDKLNAQTVSLIFSTLPAEVRDQVKGDPVVENGFIKEYKPPTTEAMLIAIGANVENSPATQNAIKQVAGLESGTKPKGY